MRVCLAWLCPAHLLSSRLPRRGCACACALTHGLRILPSSRLFAYSFFCRGLQPISAELVRSYRARMAACLGFSAEAVAALGSQAQLPPTAPQRSVLPAAPPPGKLRMLLVNRRYSAGRSILNIDEVLEALQRRFGGIADVQLRHMEGLSLR